MPGVNCLDLHCSGRCNLPKTSGESCELPLPTNVQITDLVVWCLSTPPKRGDFPNLQILQHAPPSSHSFCLFHRSSIIHSEGLSLTVASCLCTDLAALSCNDRWTLARFSKSRRELKAPWRARQMENCNHQRCSSRHCVYFKGFLTLTLSADLSGWQGHCCTDCNSPLKMCRAKRCRAQM